MMGQLTEQQLSYSHGLLQAVQRNEEKKTCLTISFCVVGGT